MAVPSPASDPTDRPATARSPAPPRVDAVAAARALRRVSAAAGAGHAPWLHAEVARRMAERLAWIKRVPARVLDWSGRAGASTAALRAAYPRAQLELLEDPMAAGAARDAAPAWWRRFLGGAGSGIATVVAPAPGTAELLWSNMRLHFEPDPQPLLRSWRQALSPQGFLMFSTLGPGSLGVLRALYAEAGWGPAHAPFVDMHDLGDMLVEAGFAEPVMDQETLTLHYATPQALLEELHGWGANASPQRFAGLRTPRWRQHLLDLLSARAGPQGRVAIQVEVVYGHAFIAAERGPLVEPTTQIDLARMKLMLGKPRPR